MPPGRASCVALALGWAASSSSSSVPPPRAGRHLESRLDVDPDPTDHQQHNDRVTITPSGDAAWSLRNTLPFFRATETVADVLGDPDSSPAEHSARRAAAGDSCSSSGRCGTSSGSSSRVPIRQMTGENRDRDPRRVSAEEASSKVGHNAPPTKRPALHPDFQEEVEKRSADFSEWRLLHFHDGSSIAFPASFKNNRARELSIDAKKKLSTNSLVKDLFEPFAGRRLAKESMFAEASSQEWGLSFEEVKELFKNRNAALLEDGHAPMRALNMDAYSVGGRFVVCGAAMFVMCCPVC